MLNYKGVLYLIIQGSKVLLEEVAWDAGYGQNKIVCQSAIFKSEGSKPQEFYTKLAFPSYYAICKPSSQLESIKKIDGISLDKLIVNYNGISYTIGKNAIIQSPGSTKQTFDKDKFKSDGEVSKFLAGMAYIFPLMDEIIIEKLIVGLSLESYSEFKNEIQEFYQSKYFDFSILNSGQMKPIKIFVNEVSCKIQGNGAFFDKFFDMTPFGNVMPSRDNQRLKHVRFGICDTGSKTVDNYLSEGTEPIDGTEIVFNRGINNVFKSVSEQIGGYPENRLEDIYLQWINTKISMSEKRPDLVYQGKKYLVSEVAKMVDEAFYDFGKEIAEKLKQSWNEHLDLVELLILCGGGANSSFFLKAFKDTFPFDIEICNEPQFANAFGYLKAAKFERQISEKLAAKKNS